MMSFGVPLGTHRRVPEGDIEARQPGLVDGRDVGRGGQAALGGDRIGLDLAAAHLRQRDRRLVEHQVDLPGDQVLHGRAGAAIRHELEAAPVAF